MAVAMDFVHMEQEVVGPARPQVGRKSLVALAAGATAGAVVVACTGLAGSVQDENTDGRALAQRAVQVEECIPASKAGKITGAAYEPLGMGFFEVPPNECRSACLTHPDCGVYTYRAHPQNKDDYFCALFNRNVTLSDVYPTEEYVTETRACEYENQDADTDDNSGTSSWLDEVPDKISAIWDSFGFDLDDKECNITKGHIRTTSQVKPLKLGSLAGIGIEDREGALKKCREMCLKIPECQSISVRPGKRCSMYAFDPALTDISNKTTPRGRRGLDESELPPREHDYHKSSWTDRRRCFPNQENKRWMPKGVTWALSHVVPVVVKGALNAAFSRKEITCEFTGQVHEDYFLKRYPDMELSEKECRQKCEDYEGCNSFSHKTEGPGGRDCYLYSKEDLERDDVGQEGRQGLFTSYPMTCEESSSFSFLEDLNSAMDGLNSGNNSGNADDEDEVPKQTKCRFAGKVGGPVLRFLQRVTMEECRRHCRDEFPNCGSLSYTEGNNRMRGDERCFLYDKPNLKEADILTGGERDEFVSETKGCPVEDVTPTTTWEMEPSTSEPSEQEYCTMSGGDWEPAVRTCNCGENSIVGTDMMCECAAGYVREQEEWKCVKEDCDKGFFFNGAECQPKICTCEHGYPAVGAECPTNEAMKCTDVCKWGYTFDATTFTCQAEAKEVVKGTA